jgi:hypothetical protein
MGEDANATATPQWGTITCTCLAGGPQDRQGHRDAGQPELTLGEQQRRKVGGPLLRSGLIANQQHSSGGTILGVKQAATLQTNHLELGDGAHGEHSSPVFCCGDHSAPGPSSLLLRVAPANLHPFRAVLPRPSRARPGRGVGQFREVAWAIGAGGPKWAEKA